MVELRLHDLCSTEQRHFLIFSSHSEVNALELLEHIQYSDTDFRML